MKLHQALKLKKKLVGEISQLKSQIINKNSYMVGSLNETKYDVRKLYDELKNKINELIDLKLKINKANSRIQADIFTLSENKALIAFWNGLQTREGLQDNYGSDNPREYKSQIDEVEKDAFIRKYQTDVDELQEKIDVYNYTTEI